jgi:hypothetical protein
MSSSSFDEDNLMEEVPEEYICPLTLCIMSDPVVSKDGKNYDRKAILKWLAGGHGNCPLTRQPLHLSSLVPNHKLRRSIQEWKVGYNLDCDKRQCSLDRSMRNLASFGLIVEFTDDMMKHVDLRHPQRQQQRPGTQSSGSVSDLLALYDEVLDLTDGGRSRSSSGTPITDRSGNRSDASIDDELRDIREMYDEILELGQATTALSSLSKNIHTAR